MAAANANSFALPVGVRMRGAIKILELAISGSLLLGLAAYVVHGLGLIAVTIA
jgi:hypothetical protein